VRYTFGRDPEGMSEQEFFKLLGEATWLREERVQEIEEALARVVVRSLSKYTEETNDHQSQAYRPSKE